MSYADYLIIIAPPGNIIKEISRHKMASVNVIVTFESMHKYGTYYHNPSNKVQTIPYTHGYYNNIEKIKHYFSYRT